jgi:hypothetical protein
MLRLGTWVSLVSRRELYAAVWRLTPVPGGLRASVPHVVKVPEALPDNLGSVVEALMTLAFPWRGPTAGSTL